MYEDFYIVTNKDHTFDRYVTFLEKHADSLMPYWKDQGLPNESHRFYLKGIHDHSTMSNIRIAILQDIQTKQVFLVDSKYITREE